MNRTMGLILIITLLFTNTGCWDVKDVADTAFITAIGLDASERPGMLKITFVVPKPIVIRGRTVQEFTINQTVEAESLAGAVEKLETRLSRSAGLGHLRIIVIGENQARKNLRGFTNFFEKNPEVALRTKISFVQGAEAKEMLAVSPIINRSNASELVGMLMTGRKNSLGRPITLQELRKGLLKNNGTALASRFSINAKQGKPFVEHEGGTVLKEWRVIGWLDENENKAANWFIDGALPIVAGEIDGGHYTFLVERKSLKIIPTVNGGNLSFLVKVNASARVSEEHFGLDLSKPGNIKKTEQLVSRIVTDQVSEAVYKSQKQLRTDYLGFGRALEIKNSKLYGAIDWPKIFSDVPVTVKVQAKVHRFGKTK